MNFKITHRAHGSRRLLLFFCGWGTDASVLCNVAPADMDVAAVWDYRSYDFDVEALAGYDEICLMAWSFGVPAAADFLAAHPQLPVTQRIAVAGTLRPVDDRLGIPESIFRGTLDGLDERNLRKFYRRMCGSAKACAEFMERLEPRPVEELKEELSAVASRSSSARRADMWDTVLIPEADAIIPPDNQLRAWEGTADIRVIPAPHMPDFAELIPLFTVNKKLVAERFGGSAGTYADNATVQTAMARRLLSMWPDGLRPARTIEIGAGTGTFTRMYLERIDCERLELWDLADLAPDLPGKHRIADAETAILDLPHSTADAIVSSACVQWFSSPVVFSRRALDRLAPGGMLLLSTFGPDNFRELAEAGMPAIRYPDAEAWRRIAASEADLTVEEERTTVQFSSAAELLRHMRLTGVNAIESHPGKAAALARNILRSDVRSLTYHAIYVRALKRANGREDSN